MNFKRISILSVWLSDSPSAMTTSLWWELAMQINEGLRNGLNRRWVRRWDMPRVRLQRAGGQKNGFMDDATSAEAQLSISERTRPWDHYQNNNGFTEHSEDATNACFEENHGNFWGYLIDKEEIRKHRGIVIKSTSQSYSRMGSR